MNVYQKIKQYSISEILLITILVTLFLRQNVNSIAIILFFLLAIYNFIRNDSKVCFNKLSLLLISFYVLCILSLLWSNNLDKTKVGLTRFLSFLVLPIAFSFNFAKQFKKEKIVNIFARLLILCALYCLSVGVINAINNSDISYLFYHKLSNSLSNLNAIYLSVFVSLGISFLLNKETKSKLDIFNLLILSLFLILLSSKIIISITLLTTIFLFFKRRKFKIKSFPIIILISLGLFLAGTNFFNRIKLEFEKTKINEVLNKTKFGPVYLWTGFGLRVFQAKAFVEISQENKNIFLGSGLSNSQDNLNQKYKEYNFYHGFLNYNYHNQYIQIIAELGVIGLCLFLLILILILKEAIFYRDYFLLSFIILILVVCIT